MQEEKSCGTCGNIEGLSKYCDKCINHSKWKPLKLEKSLEIKWAINKTPKEWRKNHKLTQSEMAKLLNMSRGAYNALEQGKSTPAFETIIKMQWLGESIKEIENKGEYKGYSVLRIGGMYEVKIKEE